MSEINDIDFEEDQQEIIEKTDISTLANYCKELKAYDCLLYTSPSPRDS